MIRPALVLTREEIAYLFEQLDVAEDYETDCQRDPSLASKPIAERAKPLRQKMQQALADGCNIVVRSDAPEVKPPAREPEIVPPKRRGRPPKPKPTNP